MDEKEMNSLRERLGRENMDKLLKIDNPDLHAFVAKYVELCNPDRVLVSTDSPEDIRAVREAALRDGEERRLANEGHTIHFDNAGDQARDKEHTLILLPKGEEIGSAVATGDREDGCREVHEILRDLMKGHTLFVRFFCLGPTSSDFSIPAVQLTDSSYVAHSEDLLYRPGYEEFVRQGRKARFFKFVHSQGELDERKTSRNLDKRRVYIDPTDETVYSTNTQYGGNTIGLKKLAMRLAIYRGSLEGWLTEHMFVLGVNGPGGRVTYFTGAFPSLCGKTSTAMLDGERIVGDDIAYLRRKDGLVRAVNVEKGMFGIIQGVNSKDDPSQWKALHSPGEIIFSNVLVTPEHVPHWIGKDGEVPPRGENHTGEWLRGKKDEGGKEIPPSHPNARFTLSLDILDNLDPVLEDPGGVVVGAMVYGGRDSDTWVPVEEAFDWNHGIITKGAMLESETTAATLGKEGVRKFNLMSNLDFLSIPLAKYIRINLDFAKGLKSVPLIFSVNYFLRGKDGGFLNEREDKRVWYKWMERRVHGEAEAIDTPTGRIPAHGDLQALFRELLGKDYSKEAYDEQFSVKVPQNLQKIDRIRSIYESRVPGTPPLVFEMFEAQRKRLLEAQARFGDLIPPDRLVRPR
jgi:phosphoenolpyruvate carboxykinase (GTP)